MVTQYLCCVLRRLVVTLCDPKDYSPPGSSVHGTLQRRIVGCHFLLQRIFQTQGSNWHLLCLLYWKVNPLPLVPPGKPQSNPTPRYKWNKSFSIQYLALFGPCILGWVFTFSLSDPLCPLPPALLWLEKPMWQLSGMWPWASYLTSRSLSFLPWFKKKKKWGW